MESAEEEARPGAPDLVGSHLHSAPSPVSSSPRRRSPTGGPSHQIIDINLLPNPTTSPSISTPRLPPPPPPPRSSAMEGPTTLPMPAASASAANIGTAPTSSSSSALVFPGSASSSSSAFGSASSSSSAYVCDSSAAVLVGTAPVFSASSSAYASNSSSASAVHLGTTPGSASSSGPVAFGSTSSSSDSPSSSASAVLKQPVVFVDTAPFAEVIKRREKEVAAREEELRLRVEQTGKQRCVDDIKRRDEVADLGEKEQDLKQREDALTQREHEFQVRRRQAGLREREEALKVRHDTLEQPLLEVEEVKHDNKDEDMWNKRLNFTALALISGLSIMISAQPHFPPDYLSFIVGSFAVVWVLASVALPLGLFGTHRIEKEVSRHVSRFSFTCFIIFTLYVLYVLSIPPAPDSSCVSTSVTPRLTSWFSTIDGRGAFYIVLGIIAVLTHLALWISGCVTGGDRDP